MTREYCHDCKSFRTATGQCECAPGQPQFLGTPDEAFAALTADLNARYQFDEGDENDGEADVL